MSGHDTRDPLESLLVRAARSQRAPRVARERIRAAVGLAAGSAALAAASAAAAASGKQAIGAFTVIGIAKYVAIGAACGVLTLGVARMADPPGGQDARVRTAPTAVSATAQGKASPAPLPAASASASASAAVSATPPLVSLVPAVSASAVPTLAGELAVLDEARGALRRQDCASALRALGEYARQYPRGQMSAEAMVLRIQALVQSGDRAAAESLARSFEKGNPNSPLVERVRAIVGDTNP